MTTYTVPDDFATADAAIAAAQSGDVVHFTTDFDVDFYLGILLDKDNITIQWDLSKYLNVLLQAGVATTSVVGEFYYMKDTTEDNKITITGGDNYRIELVGGDDTLIFGSQSTTLFSLFLDWHADTTDADISVPDALFKSGQNSLTSTSLSQTWLDIWTGSGNDHVVIGHHANSVTTAGGNDIIDARNGVIDLQIAGGTGDDTYYIDSLYAEIYMNADQVNESNNAVLGGDDLVVLSGRTPKYYLSPYVERLVVTADVKGDLFGNESDNVITGNDFANFIDGRGGTDRLVGGKGNDVYTIDRQEDVVVENAGEGTDKILFYLSTDTTYVLPDLIENFGVANIAYSSITVTGNAGDNVLLGQEGDDEFDGKGGADVMRGFNGNDTYHLDNAGDVIKDNYGDNRAFLEKERGHFFIDDYHGRVIFAGKGEVDLTIDTSRTGQINIIDIVANDSANRITCGARSGKIDAGGGDDVIIGLSTTKYLSQGLKIYGGGGDDVIRGSPFLYGENGRDTLIGSDSFDRLYGGAGRDEMRGGADADIYIDVEDRDVIIEAVGTTKDDLRDTAVFRGSGRLIYHLPDNVERLQLRGNLDLTGIGTRVDDEISGGNGDDILIGGLGADVMAGGFGRDVFVYRSGSESSGGSADTIWGFRPGMDKIDVSAFSSAGGSGSVLKRGADFTGETNQVRYDISSPYANFSGTVLAIDIDGDRNGDLEIRLAKFFGQLDVSDFVF